MHEHMLTQVKAGIPIYGTTTSYGAQADKHITQQEADSRLHEAKILSNAIIHIDVSTGPLLPDDVVRAAILIRLNMLLPGYSAIRMSLLKKLAEVLNKKIIPLVGSYGTLGASGDLALNGRVISMILHRPETQVKDEQGNIGTAPEVLNKVGIDKLELDPKEGLALANGDNFSTAAAALIFHDLDYLVRLNIATAALNIQALKGSIRNFHPLFGAVRPHQGQVKAAKWLFKLLKGSQLAAQDINGHQRKEPGNSVQDPYSIRCLPQFYGPDIETLERAKKTIEINANSVSDNPLWTTPETATPGEDPYLWASGGNFLAMHMSDTLDSLRKVAIHLVKQNDRHLNRLVNDKLSNGLPPNLSPTEALAKCVFKGLQTQMGMYEVYASLLASPVSTAFGIHEELNQDITSHAMTSAILTWKVLELVRYSVSTNLIAAAQAIDLRGGPTLLSPQTQPLYHWVRKQVPFVSREQPMGHFVESMAQKLITTPPQLPKELEDE